MAKKKLPNMQFLIEHAKEKLSTIGYPFTLKGFNCKTLAFDYLEVKSENDINSPLVIFLMSKGQCYTKGFIVSGCQFVFYRKKKGCRGTV